MVAQAQFSASDVPVEPGGSVTLALSLFNLGDHTETFTLIPSGLVAGWVRLTPAVVTLFGGSHEVVEVTLRPPLLASTTAGPAPLTIRIIAQNEPDDVSIAETTVLIGAFHDRRVHVIQPVVRGSRRATFEFLIENHGNAQASCRLHLIDTTRRLDGSFDPPAVGIEPGAKSLVRLRLKALQRVVRPGSRTIAFSVEADQQGFPTAEAHATFVQTSLLPDRAVRKLIAAMVVGGAVVAAWFGLIKPAAERAAKDAVKGQTPVAVPTTIAGEGPQPQSTIDTGNTTPIPTPTGSTPFNQRLALKVAPGASDSEKYVVPSGKVLRITDVVLQNPNFDTGPASLALDDEILVPWQLENSTGNESLPLVSPLVFRAGDSVVFRFTCDSVGDAPSGSCSPAVLLSGTLSNG